MSVIVNRGLLLLAKKFREYQKSGAGYVSGILTVMGLIFFTVISFAAINVGLNKIDPSLYEVTINPTFFTFFYYSFNTLLFNSIKEITPVLPVSQSANMMEEFFALLLVAIFVSLVFSVRSERYSVELDDAVATFENQSRLMDSFISSEFGVATVDDAITELTNLKSGMIKIILFLSQ